MKNILEKLEALDIQHIKDREKLLFEELNHLKTERIYSSDSFINIIKYMDLNNEKTLRKIFKVLFDETELNHFDIHESELIKILNYNNIGVKFLIHTIEEIGILSW
jgi:hypothetical protein